MIPKIFSFLLDKAITLADRVIDGAIDKHFPVEQKRNAIAVEDVLRQTVGHLSDLTAASRDAIIGKIEADKLELLHSRIQNLGFVIRLGKINDAFTYLLNVKESVDYAENRLREGKHEWLGPVILGKTTVVAALTFLKVDSESEAKSLTELCMRARHQLLDELVAQRFTARLPIPWEQVHAFLSGTVEASSLFKLGVDVPDDREREAETQTRVNEVIDVNGVFQVTMPTNAFGSFEGEVLAINVKPGDRVKANQTIIVVESDKVTIDIPTLKDGIVRQLKVAVGDETKSGDIIALVDTSLSPKTVLAQTSVWPYPTSSRP